MAKRQHSRASILREALDLSSELGLEGLTIGSLAKRAGMSKSGLYAHFESKERLQCDVLAAAADRFVDVVMSPALKKPRGLPRVRALFEHWLAWEVEELSGGCPFVAAAAEYDDRPGAVRKQLLGHFRDLTGAIKRAAQISVEEGHLSGELDLDQFAFDFWAILLAYHQFARLLGRSDAQARASRAFDNLIRASGAS